MKKMTFTLDDDAVVELERASLRLGMPKSQVVREAVRAYGEQLRRLTDEEREAKLAAFDAAVATLPDRPRAEVEREIAAVRRARRGGGRRTTE